MISLVTTVLNDRQGCVAFFSQMDIQTCLPNEIVIVDGGSTDGTWEFLRNYQPNQPYSVRVIQEVGCNVARGRNLAIAHAKNELIASTDIGCLWEPQWLEELVQPLLEDSHLEAVMGSWQVCWDDLKSDWAKIEYVLYNQLKLIATPKSHASSRSIAYRKSLWEKIGGYPEDLTLAGDDMVFALLLHQKTACVGCAPIPRCYWQRPVSLKSFCQEARRNFRGGGEAGIWLDYGILVGGRLLSEVLLLLIGLIWLLGASPSWGGAILLSVFFVSLGLRVLRLVPTIERFHSYDELEGWFRLLFFEYLIKFWGLVGHWQGFISGFKHCHECRKRLRSLNSKMV
ncbi:MULTISPECIES: glycosyltransferase [unclassified Coleofasciculus]|uniref:glycosyltransferase n=1 Tax=unclassified Coleofasciculus TaxID=2692782 RepID=UPI00188252C9|nr:MULTISPECIES: glycosyltransferase [unclassified Coleofasciculus]MBE9127553.1 glycosyltransferase [Coleofasciculus sp. LEGE 07081]MBE9147203.1 glycosyltransferase [Coleofasciculus sp. LEGE 07092]